MMNYLLFSTILAFFVLLGKSQTSSPANFFTTNIYAAQKIQLLNQLTDNSYGWQKTTVTHNKAMPSSTYLDLIVSLVSFQSYTSNEFSFNTTVTNITLPTFQVDYVILGNSYFNHLSIHYLAVNYYSAYRWTSHNCFLCTNFIETQGFRVMKFQDIQLSNQTDIFQVVAFISGLKMYNNYQNIKEIKVQAFLDQSTSHLQQKVSTRGKTIIEWVCISTYIVYKSSSIFRSYQYIYDVGHLPVDYGINLLNWPNVPSIYTDSNQQLFGLSHILLGSEESEQKFIFNSDDVANFINGAQVGQFGGEISYFFVAQQGCSNPGVAPYFDSVSRDCYDICPAGTYPVDTPNLYCQVCHQTCLECDDGFAQNCTQCNATHLRTINAGSCLCNLGYVDVGEAICQTCGNFIEYCYNCNSTDYCLDCNYGTTFDEISVKCVCPDNQYFVSNSLLCVPFAGCLNAIDNSGSIQCQLCDAIQHFVMATDGITCVCDGYYYAFNGQCLPICGDGIYVQTDIFNSCDDGNNMTGDGCDATCQIQIGYGCHNPLQNTSTCAPLLNAEFEYLFTQRQPGTNIAVMVFQVLPYKAVLSDSSLFDINTSIPHSSISTYYDQETSLLKVNVAFLQTIQQVQHQLTINLEPTKFYYVGRTFQRTLTGANLELTYAENINLVDMARYLGIAVSFLGLVVFFMMVFWDQKLPATQLLLSSHLVCLATTMTGKNPYVSGLTSLKYMFGFNCLETFQISPNNMQIAFILPLEIFKQFSLNYNITACLQVLSVILMVPFQYKIAQLNHKKNLLLNYEYDADQGQQMPTISQTKKQIYGAKLQLKTYYNKFYYPISLVCMIPVMLFFSAQTFATDINNKFRHNPIYSLTPSIVCFFLNLGFISFIYHEEGKKKSIFTFSKTINFSSYPFFLILIYFGVSLLYSALLMFQIASYILLAGSMLPLVFRLIFNPYPSWRSLGAVDSFVKTLISSLCIGILLMIKLQLVQKGFTMVLIVLILLLLNIILSIIRFTVANCQQSSQTKQQQEIVQQGQQKENQLSEKEVKGVKKLKKKSIDQLEEISSQDDHSQVSQAEKQAEMMINQNIQNHYTPVSKLEENNFLQSHREEQKQYINGKDRKSSLHESDEEDQNMDQLAKIKKKLRADLKKRRGAVNTLDASDRKNSHNKKPKSKINQISALKNKNF